jgi:hypothetical protein
MRERERNITNIFFSHFSYFHSLFIAKEYNQNSVSFIGDSDRKKTVKII